MTDQDDHFDEPELPDAHDRDGDEEVVNGTLAAWSRGRDVGFDEGRRAGAAERAMLVRFLGGAEAALAATRLIVNEAPHEDDCYVWVSEDVEVHFGQESDCSCWKKRALATIDGGARRNHPPQERPQAASDAPSMPPSTLNALGTVKTPDEIRAEIMRPRRPGPRSNAYIDALEWALGATYDGDGYWSDGYVDLAEQARLDAEVDAERTDHAEQTTTNKETTP